MKIIQVQVSEATAKKLKECAEERGVAPKRLGGDIIKIKVHEWKPD